MSRLIKAKIDVMKIDKSKLFKGQKGTYLDMDIWINDVHDQYGNIGNISHSMSKEEREGGAVKVFIGNVSKEYDIQSEQNKPAPKQEETDDLPF
jgi:hypothetical protein